MKFNQYPCYKRSIIPWINKVPSHWRCIRAKWLFKKMKRPVKDSDEVITCFRDGVVTLRKNRRTLGFTESLREIGYQGVRKGDLVIHQMDAFAGAVGVSDSNGKGSPVYSVCTIKEELNTYYFAKIIREMAQSKFILSLAKGIRERSTDFRFEIFGRQILPVPPLDEQKIIASFIRAKERKITKFIKNKIRLIQLLKEQKQAIINQAVTRGINSNVNLKPSGVEWLGDIPEHWTVLLQRRISKSIKTGGTPPGADEKYFSSEGFNWYTPSDFKGELYLENSERQLSSLGKDYIKIFPPNTVMMIGIGGTIGKVAISKFSAGCNQQINGIIVNEKIKVEFLVYYLRFLKEYIVKCGKYTTLPIINQEETKNLPVLLPSVKEQKEIIKYIKNESKEIDMIVSRIKHEIELIQEYCTRLISDVVTGKLDVRNIKVNNISDKEINESLSINEEMQDLNDSIKGVSNEH